MPDDVRHDVVAARLDLSLEEFRALVRRGIAVRCVDARGTAGAHLAGPRLPGAVRVALDAPGTWAMLPRDRHLVVYGTGCDDSRVATLVEGLITRGFAASYLRGGLDAWLAAGLPLHGI